MNRAKAIASICSAAMFAITLLWAACLLAQAVPPAPAAPTNIWTWVQANWGMISAAIVALGALWAAWTGKIKVTPTPAPPPTPPPVIPPVVPPVNPIAPGTPVIDALIALLPTLIQLLFKARQEGRKAEVEALQAIIDKTVQAASEPPKH